MNSTQRIECYVIAPYASLVAPLLKSLRSAGFEVDDRSVLVPAGQSPLSGLQAELKTAACVIAVIESESDSMVLFELGLALGQGKACFLIAVGTSVPSAIDAVPFVKVPSLKDEAVTFHLAQFYERVAAGRRKSGGPKKAARPAAEKFLFSTPFSLQSEHGSSARNLEGYVATVLQAAGARSFSSDVPERQAIGAPDIVVWFDNMPGTLSNPVIVEVKKKVTSRDQVVKQMQPYLRSAGTKTALLVVEELSAKEVSAYPSDAGYVFMLSSASLFRLVEAGTLLQTLVHARNVAAHGEWR